MAKRRILVAEDDPQMLEVVTDVLRRDGHTVTVAKTGRELLVAVALTIGGTEAFDLIVSDVRMPVCDGLQVVESLRRGGHLLPVILMTAFGDDETRVKAERLGAVFFNKPFSLLALRQTVTRLLE